MDLETPQNQSVLAYLRRPSATRIPLLPVVRPDEFHGPYDELAHPEVVQRIWDDLGSPLPRDFRRIVYSRPALVHPITATIFVLGLGTLYALRLPPSLIALALSRGAFTSIQSTFGGEMNAQRDLGNNWGVGRWFAEEAKWCMEASEYFGAGHPTPL